jgi:glycosyltransferase involved in cell wall biosynthesis
MAMKHLKTNAVLVIAGIGDIFGLLGKMTMEESLSERVIFLGQVPMEHLHEYTQSADLGLSIEKNVSLNYYFCLPNKFLDYIQANVPVLVSPFPEMKSIVDAYQIGEFIESHDAVILAAQLDRLLSDVDKLTRFRKNLLIAAEELCWEKEERVLLELVNFGFENTRTLEQQKIEN